MYRLLFFAILTRCPLFVVATVRFRDRKWTLTVKETIQQVSMSKKWDSKPALDEHGKPLLNANGKTVL